MTAAGRAAPTERWSRLAVRALGAVGVAIGVLAVIVAAYGLIAVFGASARFAGDRAKAREWLRAYQAASVGGTAVPTIDPQAALALTASVPLSPQIVTIIQDGRLPLADRQLLVESLGPAFCLNPREVLFGIAPGRLRAREGARLLIGADREPPGRFEPAPLEGGGVAGLRRRARYCEQYFGGQASISPQPKPSG